MHWIRKQPKELRGYGDTCTDSAHTSLGGGRWDEGRGWGTGKEGKETGPGLRSHLQEKVSLQSQRPPSSSAIRD